MSISPEDFFSVFEYTAKSIMEVNGQQWDLNAMHPYMNTIRSRLQKKPLFVDAGNTLLSRTAELTRFFDGVLTPHAEFIPFITDLRNVVCALIGATGDVIGCMQRGLPIDHGSIFSAWSTASWQLFLFSNTTTQQARKFCVRPHVAAVLTETDVRVPGNTVELPVPFMVVELPKHMFTLVDSVGLKHKTYCTHLIISRQKLRFSEDEPVDCLVVMHIGQVTDQLPAGLISVMSIKLDDKPMSVSIAEWGNADSVKLVKSHIATITSTVKSARKDESVLVNFAANLALYCTNRASDVVANNQATLDRLQAQVRKHPQGSKKKRAADNLRIAQRDSIYVIGSSFRASDANVAKMLDEGRKINVKHIVRGHWKMQVYGAGRKERKQVFIQPYWRGPDLADVVARKYVV